MEFSLTHFDWSPVENLLHEKNQSAIAESECSFSFELDPDSAPNEYPPLFAQSEQMAFNDIYNVVREELTDEQRQNADQFFTIVNYWRLDAGYCGGKIKENIAENRAVEWKSDIELDDPEGGSLAFYSPGTIKRLHELSNKVDFAQIESWIEILNPVADGISNGSKFSKPDQLKNYDSQRQFSRFESVSEVVRFSRQFIASISFAVENGYGVRMLAHY